MSRPALILVQELNRETNTIKGLNREKFLFRHIIGMKGQRKIREQGLNIE